MIQWYMNIILYEFFIKIIKIYIFVEKSWNIIKIKFDKFFLNSTSLNKNIKNIFYRLFLQSNKQIKFYFN